MTKQEAIELLKEHHERLKHVDDSYDKESLMTAIEMGVDAILVCIDIEKYVYDCEKEAK